MTISLTDLKAKRSAMTQGEWRQGAHERDAIFVPYREGLGHERVVLRMNKNGEFAEPAIRDAIGIVATHNAADALIAVCEAAKAWSRDEWSQTSPAWPHLLAALARIEL